MYCYRALKKQNIEVWLSLVEHHVRDVGAAGSNPVTSTKKDGFLNAAGSNPVTSTKKDGFLNRLFLIPKGSKPLKIGAKSLFPFHLEIT